jgi:hypothetical protein
MLLPSSHLHLATEGLPLPSISDSVRHDLASHVLVGSASLHCHDDCRLESPFSLPFGDNFGTSHLLGAAGLFLLAETSGVEGVVQGDI